ncbi:MAG: hypothetical protein A2X55_07795 [Nitrospirae bacterium GWB2_47_37]|nr:MAG: hypothetical protein A2X55_07795 [Nitrospirae bacterium GWB2_47_37]
MSIYGGQDSQGAGAGAGGTGTSPMSLPIPGLSFTSTKQQTAVNSSQNLVFTPTINVQTESPNASAPSSYNIPTTQTPAISQTQPTSFAFSPVPNLSLGTPVGDLYGQSPLSGASSKQPVQASFFDDNMLIILLIAGGAALLFFGKKK